MKFKVDENLPVEICNLLKDAGHEALTVLEQKMGGKPDQDLLSLCRKEDRAMVNLDFDFCHAQLTHLLRVAQEKGLFVRIDMEDSSCVPSTLELHHRMKKEGFSFKLSSKK